MKININWKLFFLLLIGGVLGTLAVLPFALTLQADLIKELPITLPVFVILQIVQTTILLAITTFIGLTLSKKVGFKIPILEAIIDKNPVSDLLIRTIRTSVKFGIIAGILIIAFDKLFSLFIEPITSIAPPIWQAAIASLYGGITEELLMRLFLMTLITWITFKFWKSEKGEPTGYGVWFAITVAAIIFGIGHLPATAALTTITPIIIARAILLNGVGGVIFGWLYWKKGLESAMIAHFTTDIVILVIFPLIITLT